jgi:3',5'-cyclic AMP phosphodiesterase CpdA
MKVNRRTFLTLGGLSSIGVPLLLRQWHPFTTHSEGLPATAAPKSTGSGQPLLHFVAVADTGTGVQGQYAVAQAMANYHSQTPYELVILAGDNIYSNGIIPDGDLRRIGDVFEKPYRPLLEKGVKFYAALGNHDVATDAGNPQLNYPGFNMNGQRYYTLQRGPIQFFALDLNPGKHLAAQRTWLQQQLRQSKAQWKIVFSHFPIYSSGIYGVDQDLVRELTPLFKKYGVQLYINGHDHDYERTQPIDGTTYLTCGAGAGLRPVFKSKWTAYSASQLSFAAITVYGDRIEIKGIDAQNQVMDEGRILLAKTPAKV